MAMGEEMKMPMGMNDIFMSVDMLMDQVNPEEEVQVIQDLPGVPFRHNGVVFFHDHCPVGNLLKNR